MRAMLEQLRVANERPHAESVRLLRDAYVGGLCRELLKERGCTSDDDVVFVPALIADFLDAKEAEIQRLRAQLAPIPEEPKTEACAPDTARRRSPERPPMAGLEKAIRIDALEERVDRQTNEINRLLGQLQRRDNHDDLSESWLWKENHQLNTRIEKLLNALIVLTTTSRCP